jgi:hypothetical protein
MSASTSPVNGTGSMMIRSRQSVICLPVISEGHDSSSRISSFSRS